MRGATDGPHLTPPKYGILPIAALKTDGARSRRRARHIWRGAARGPATRARRDPLPDPSGRGALTRRPLARLVRASSPGTVARRDRTRREPPRTPSSMPGGGTPTAARRRCTGGVAPGTTDPGCGSSIPRVSAVLLPTRQRTRVEEPTGDVPDGRHRDRLPTAQRRGQGAGPGGGPETAVGTGAARGRHGGNLVASGRAGGGRNLGRHPCGTARWAGPPSCRSSNHWAHPDGQLAQRRLTDSLGIETRVEREAAASAARMPARGPTSRELSVPARTQPPRRGASPSRQSREARPQ